MLKYYISVWHCGRTFKGFTTQLQPNFPLVYPILGHSYTGLGESDRS